MRHSVSRIYPVPANNGRKNSSKIPIEYQYTMKRAIPEAIKIQNSTLETLQMTSPMLSNTTLETLQMTSLMLSNILFSIKSFHSIIFNQHKDIFESYCNTNLPMDDLKIGLMYFARPSQRVPRLQRIHVYAHSGKRYQGSLQLLDRYSIRSVTSFDT